MSRRVGKHASTTLDVRSRIFAVFIIRFFAFFDLFLVLIM